MTILFLILIILACVILGFVVLVQNPKGGGLAGNVAGISNQFMGVKQTNDVLEKGTWIFSVVIALLCVFSTFFMTGSSGNDNDILNKINTSPDILNKINTSPGTIPSRQTLPASATQPTAPPASNQTK